MALSIVEVLDAHGGIDRDALALAFARRYAAEPHRGFDGQRRRDACRAARRLAHTTPGPTHDGIAKSLELPLSYEVRTAVAALGNGSLVISSD